MGVRSGVTNQETAALIRLSDEGHLCSSIGSLNAPIIHPREILKPAILASAACIILVHNHPTGDPAPSTEDVEFTRRFGKCGELIGITLLDHVIIGDDRYYSLKETGTF